MELIRAKPESLTFHADKGKNIFHLCVMHNHLEILKDLVALDTHDTNELLIEGDSDGNNTILHLAIMSKQVETVRYLMSIPKIRSEATKLKNEVGQSGADIAERIPQDSMSLEIQAILMQQCGINFAAAREEEVRCDGKSLTNFLKWMRRLMYGDDDWVEKMRGNISLVPAIVSTITYQAATNPPGGIVQQSINTGAKNSTLNYGNPYDNWIKNGPLGCLLQKDEKGVVTAGICPGEAILAYRENDDFNKFMIYNSIAFVISLIVAFLLLSGIPLKSKSMMWVLTFGMLSNLTFLLNAYFASIILIAPSQGSIHYSHIITTISWTFNACFIHIAVYIVVMRLMGSIMKRNTASR